MSLIEKQNISTGITWIDIPDASLSICCGCPADTVKHLKKAGVIKKIKTEKGMLETGPNALLLSDALLQNGQVANLTEFPIMQMLYLQGMHSNMHKDTPAIKPILIGLEEHIRSQMLYIYRGNYGLISLKEIIDAGVGEEMAEKIYAIKEFFSNGSISSPDDLFTQCIVKNSPIEIKNGVFIERLSFNKYKIQYKNESEIVDLNLATFEHYQPSFHLPNIDIPRDYFTVIHSGEGNGWDTERPCMASIVIYEDKIHIIDAGPNILNNLNHLGISAYEIDGIFLTHIHDDHFAGLTELIKADKRFNFYSSRMVRETAQKKLAALMNFPEKAFHYVFDCKDLAINQWNNLSGLQVKPVFSPHPVETNAFFFKAGKPGSEKIFAHIADVIAISEFEKIINNDKNGLFTSEDAKTLKENYTAYADLKKVDVGGGAIHGSLSDFDIDKSAKIVLSHTEFLNDIPEARRHQTRRFGEFDILIKHMKDSFFASRIISYLQSYLSDLSESQLQPFLDLPILKFAPGDQILDKNQKPKRLCLILTGIVSGDQNDQLNEQIPAGSIIGNSDIYVRWVIPQTYIAFSYVNVLVIDETWMNNYIKELQIDQGVDIRLKEISFLLKVPLIGKTVSYAVLNRIRSTMVREEITENMNWKVHELTDLFVIEKGEGVISYEGKGIFVLQKNDHFGGILKDIQINRKNYDILLKKGSAIYKIPESTLLKIPNVLWKVLEVNEKRSLLCSLSK